ncbi:uncharacterized protein [Diadema antillarum]|uniref:uncharacterized protein n=1 Tax=Diadema antillarum TaxID=105358 RepID=UPI003A8B08BA
MGHKEENNEEEVEPTGEIVDVEGGTDNAEEENNEEEEEAEPTGEIVDVEGGTDNAEDNTEPEGGDEGEEGGVEVVESPEEQPLVEPGQTQEEENNEEEEAEPAGEIVDVEGGTDNTGKTGRSPKRGSQITLRGNFEADEPRNVEIDIKPAGKLRSLKIWGTITKYALRTCISEDFSDETCSYVRDDGGDIKTFTADEDENKVQLSQFEIDNVYGVVIEIIEAAEGQCNVRYRITLDKKGNTETFSFVDFKFKPFTLDLFTAGKESPQIGARTCTRFPSRRRGNNDRSSRSGSSRRESQVTLRGNFEADEPRNVEIDIKPAGKLRSLKIWGTITKYALRTCISEDFSDETCPYVKDDGGDIKTFTADEDENKVQLSQFEIDNVYGVVIEIIEAEEGQCNVRYRITLDKKAGNKSPQIGARTCTRFPSRRGGTSGQSSRRGSQGNNDRSSRSGSSRRESQVTLRGNFEADEPRNVEIDIKPAGKLRSLKIWGTITKYALRTCISEDFSDETCPYVKDDGGDIKTFTADEDENKVQLSQFEIDNVYGVVIEIIEAAEGQCNVRYRITLDKKAGEKSPQIGARTCTRFPSRRSGSNGRSSGRRSQGSTGQSSRRGSQGSSGRSSRSGSQVTLRGNFQADEPRNVEIDIKPAGKLRNLKIWGTITKYALRTCISEDFSDETCPYVRDDGGDIKTFTADEDENKVQLSQFEIDNVYGVVIEIIEAAEGQCNVRYRITLDKKGGKEPPQVSTRTCTRFGSGSRGRNRGGSSKKGGNNYR